VYPRGDAIVPINPRAWVDQALQVNDILLSKDSNVGEVAVVDTVHASGHMGSGGVLRLNPAFNRWYLLAFLKHPSFVSQCMRLLHGGHDPSRGGALAGL
jgi:hypothetical protein